MKKSGRMSQEELSGEPNRKSHNSLRSNDFTLIELLAVISILSILMCILLPALGKAKEQAKKISCLGNFKQIGLAMMGYVEDNKEWLSGCNLYDQDTPTNKSARWYIIPAYYAGLQSNLTMAAWEAQVSPKNFRIMRCPADATKNGTTEYCNYGLNSLKSNEEAGATGVDKRRLNQFRYPSEMMWSGDSISNNYGADGASYRNYCNGTTTALYQTIRHPGSTANFLYVDGHVDSQNLTFLIKEGTKENTSVKSHFYDSSQAFK